jgi:hypothetical protein
MNLWVVIVDNPDKGPVEGNFKVVGQNGPERCQHLQGDRAGEYSCAVHNRPWYQETPCFQHGQIEKNVTDKCRMGAYLMEGRK